MENTIIDDITDLFSNMYLENLAINNLFPVLYEKNIFSEIFLHLNLKMQVKMSFFLFLPVSMYSKFRLSQKIFNI